MREQIDEMAKILHSYCDGDCSICGTGSCVDDSAAEALYDAGYRKIIHCKDCAYRDTEGCPNTYWNGGELESNVEDDDFCSVAKMKGGAE